MTAQGIDIDLREDFLEDHWRDGCCCELKHQNTRCMVEAVAIRKGCAGMFLMCETGLKTTLWKISRPAEHFCSGCRRPIADCWSVIDL